MAKNSKVSDGSKIAKGMSTETVVPMYWTLTKSQKAEVDRTILRFHKATKEGREPKIDE